MKNKRYKIEKVAYSWVLAHIKTNKRIVFTIIFRNFSIESKNKCYEQV